MLLAAPLTVMFLAAASLLVEAELGDRVRQAAQGTQVGKDEADAAAMADRADMATAAATAVKAINYLLFRPAVCPVERGGETMEVVSNPGGQFHNLSPPSEQGRPSRALPLRPRPCLSWHIFFNGAHRA